MTLTINETPSPAGEREADALLLAERDGEGEDEGSVGEEDGEDGTGGANNADTVGCALVVGVSDALAVTEGVLEINDDEGVADGVMEGLAPTDREEVGVAVPLGVTLADELAVGETEGVLELLMVSDDEGVADGVTEGLAPTDREEVGVAVPLGVTLADELAVGVALRDTDGKPEGE